MIPCLSPGGTNIFRLGDAPKKVLVGSTEGIFLLERGANSRAWRVSARALPECHIHALMPEVSSGLLFAGIHNGTVYASQDWTESWELREQGITQPDVYTLSCVVAGGTTRLYAGTEPAHLFVSDDLGMSWREIVTLRSVPSVAKWNYPQPPYIAHVKQITFHPKDPKTIYVCVEQGALLRSRDGGQTWEELHGFYMDVHRLAILASDARKMYLACGDGVYYSADAGASWERLTDRSTRVGYPDGLVVHPTKETLVFISGAGTIPPTWGKNGVANSAVGRSRDGGKNWEFFTQGFPPDFKGNVEALTMAVWNGSYYLFAGTTEGDVLLSEDEGETWTVIATALPPIAKRRHHLYLRPVRGVN